MIIRMSRVRCSVGRRDAHVTRTGRLPATRGPAHGTHGPRPVAIKGTVRVTSPLQTRSRPMLVNCVAYQEGTKLSDIPKEAISDYVKRPDCFVWVALKDPTQAELEEMRDEFGLHELAVEDARHGHQRPKIEEYGNSLFAVLQTIEIKEDELKSERSTSSSARTTSSRFACTASADSPRCAPGAS